MYHAVVSPLEAIECKWNPEAFDPRGLAAFRALHPKGRNFIVSPVNGPAFGDTVQGLKVAFVSPSDLRMRLAK